MDSIYRTVDGGITWTPTRTGESSVKLLALSDSALLLIGDSIIKTDDGGMSWINITPDSGSEFPMASFMNPDTGVVA